MKINRMKKCLALLLSVCLVMCMLSDIQYANAAVDNSLGTEFNSDLYSYSYLDSVVRIDIPEGNLKEFIAEGYLEKWQSVEMKELWLDITVCSEDTMIPKELLNWAETKDGYTTIHMKDKDQDYEWRFGDSTSLFQEDFKPQVVFYEMSNAAFSADSTCLGVHTAYSTTSCAVSAKFSVNKFCLDDVVMDVSDYFKNFYDTYNTDEIKQELSENSYSYSYFNNNEPTGEIGWFYASCDDKGEMKSMVRDSCWTWKCFDGETTGHLEFNNMKQISNCDFIISDFPVIGTNVANLNSFSIISNQSNGDIGNNENTENNQSEEKTRIEMQEEFSIANLKLNIKDMNDVIQSGQLQEWVDMYENLYIEIYIYDQGRVIPKEFFNIIREKEVSLYVFINLDTEIYEWGLTTNKYFEVKRDFSPYITYERTRTTEAYFPEGTTALTFRTDCTPEVFSGGLVQKLSLNTLIVDGEPTQTSVIFKNFFQKYCIPEILEGNMYSYRGEVSESVEKGYFYLSNYDDVRGGLNGAAKDSLWQYYEDFYLDGSGRDRAHVEMNNMVMSSSGTFVISDQPPYGSDPENMHEIFERSTNKYTDYGTEELKEHFKDVEEIDAKTAASADFVKVAHEVKADIKVKKDGVEFDLGHEKIDKDIAFEPDVRNELKNNNIEQLLEQKGLEDKEHDVVSFENAFSKEEGELPGEVDVRYPVDDKIGQSGDDIKIYYYNPETKSLDLVANEKIDDRGQVHFSLEHFSEYVMVNVRGIPQATGQPTKQPTEQPTEQPTIQPTEQPTEQPTIQPTEQPTIQPAGKTKISLSQMKGKVFMDAKGLSKYKVTGKKTVTYLTGEKVEKVCIPDTIVLNGYSFKVTAVSAKAFYKNGKIKQVSIGKNVATIGKKAFYGCRKLKTVIIKTKKLQLKQIGTHAFKGVKPKKLILPKLKKIKYRHWCRKRGMQCK